MSDNDTDKNLVLNAKALPCPFRRLMFMEVADLENNSTHLRDIWLGSRIRKKHKQYITHNTQIQKMLALT